MERAAGEAGTAQGGMEPGSARPNPEALLTRFRTKKVDWTSFHLLNGNQEPVLGDKYLIARSTGALEPWMLIHIDQPNGLLMFACC